MDEVLKLLTKTEIDFVCGFANSFIGQIPYMDRTTIGELNKTYFIKKLKAKLKANKLNPIRIEIGENILKKIDIN